MPAYILLFLMSAVQVPSVADFAAELPQLWRCDLLDIPQPGKMALALPSPLGLHWLSSMIGIGLDRFVSPKAEFGNLNSAPSQEWLKAFWYQVRASPGSFS